ncbi:MAG: pitrilysin family protein [Robiginitomaculum sp.]|nr:pitrilysin family protein [Robiginitomaculum sp.]
MRYLLGTLAIFFLTACQSPTTPSSPVTTSQSHPATVKTALPDGVTLLETATKKHGEISIPFSKYRLDNGLTVILHEDHSDPLVHVDVTYHVGSGREEIGKSGFAHFFEHMMFQGSENVADEQHFKIISEAGGTLNGTTNTDRTNYFETIPNNQLEKILWLEADRMGFLLNAVTQEKFEVQRETVKNERGQNYDNRPYGLLRERVNEALYPEGHPYSWLTIGYIEDLNRVDVNDLKKVFLRWYGPNNATLTIGGDLDPEQTLKWVVKYYGSIPKGPDVAMPEKPQFKLDADRYISMEDNVALSLLYMAWPTVYARHPDEAPLDVLMSILGTGKTSLLYKNMVKNGFAVQANAGHGCQELACTFTILALPNPASGKSLADLEKIARDTLVEFEARGVEDDDLTRVKASIVSGMIYGLESVRGKVSQLAAYQTFTGDPDYIGKDIARYENVTKDDVMRVYEKYIKGKPAVIMSVVPKGKGDSIAHEDTWQRHERVLPEYKKIDADSLNVRTAKDDFDRSVQPPAGPNPTLKVPPIWRSTLDNGVKVLGALNDEAPTMTISFRIPAGHKIDPVEKVGLATLTAAMMNEATTKSTNEELSNRLQKLGSSIDFFAGDDYSVLSIRSLTDNLDETLAIAAEKLFEPKFDPADFARVQAQTIQGIEAGKKNAASTATNVFRKILYGKDNAFAWPSSGVTASVKAITLDDVKAYYADHYSPAGTSIIAVGDLSKDQLVPKLGIFAKWSGPAATKPVIHPMPKLAAGTLYLIDKPGAAQSEIRIGKRALTYDATGEYYRAGLMNYNLGGAFNSRININLREDKGYTYGARSFFGADKDAGRYTAQAGVRANVTDKSIVEFEKEIRNYAKDGMTEAELSFLKSALGQRDARAYETPAQKVRFLGQIMTYDLPDDFVDQQNTILANISREELNALAAKYLKLDDMIMVVVGDKAKILPGLQALGHPIVELDADGNPL